MVDELLAYFILEPIYAHNFTQLSLVVCCLTFYLYFLLSHFESYLLNLCPQTTQYKLIVLLFSILICFFKLFHLCFLFFHYPESFFLSHIEWIQITRCLLFLNQLDTTLELFSEWLYLFDEFVFHCFERVKRLLSPISNHRSLWLSVPDDLFDIFSSVFKILENIRLFKLNFDSGRLRSLRRCYVVLFYGWLCGW